MKQLMIEITPPGVPLPALFIFTPQDGVWWVRADWILGRFGGLRAFLSGLPVRAVGMRGYLNAADALRLADFDREDALRALLAEADRRLRPRNVAAEISHWETL